MPAGTNFIWESWVKKQPKCSILMVESELSECRSCLVKADHSLWREIACSAFERSVLVF